LERSTGLGDYVQLVFRDREPQLDFFINASRCDFNRKEASRQLPVLFNSTLNLQSTDHHYAGKNLI
jgi:hypothetical protein